MNKNSKNMYSNDFINTYNNIDEFVKNRSGTSEKKIIPNILRFDKKSDNDNCTIKFGTKNIIDKQPIIKNNTNNTNNTNIFCL